MGHSAENVMVRLAEAREAGFLWGVDQAVLANNPELPEHFVDRDKSDWIKLMAAVDSEDRFAVALVGGAFYVGYFALSSCGIQTVFNSRYDLYRPPAEKQAEVLRGKLFAPETSLITDLSEDQSPRLAISM